MPFLLLGGKAGATNRPEWQEQEVKTRYDVASSEGADIRGSSSESCSMAGKESLDSRHPSSSCRNCFPTGCNVCVKLKDLAAQMFPYRMRFSFPGESRGRRSRRRCVAGGASPSGSFFLDWLALELT